VGLPKARDGRYLKSEYERQEKTLTIDNLQLTIKRRREEPTLDAGRIASQVATNVPGCADMPAQTWAHPGGA
jgi:hypothetical protein